MHARAPTRTPTQTSPTRGESPGPDAVNSSRDCDRPARADRRRGNEATPLHRFHVFVLSLQAYGADVRLSLADLRRRRLRVLRGDQYVAESVRARQEFITVPDRAGMWWLVPIIGEVS